MDTRHSPLQTHSMGSIFTRLVVTSLLLLATPSGGFKLYDGYYNSLFRPVVEQSFKAKVETLGAILKRHVQQLRSTENRQVDLVFLVDSSASVGGVDFKEEIKFVRKLLADFTVDLNSTRVALITFSSREKVVRQVDHLTRPHRDNHKCSLLNEEIPRIKYVGGGTYTLGAFLEAKKVLRAARRDAVKAVFLITDGFSNGGDPRPEARRLRQQGVKIFTFGIRNGNVRELWEMASEPRNETCYVLDSFEEFEALARRALHSDLHSGTYVPQSPKKCGRLCESDGADCCHDNATCMCGTHTGKYECLCKPGYYGNGLGKDGCKPCPSGTYKNHTGSGDVSACTACPDENQETPIGATLVHECKCKRGFRNFNSSECTVFRCPELKEPDSGYFVNNQCNNVFNAACGLRCRPGYELRGSGLRICQEDGSWSGQDTKCVLKTCPALPAPKNGHMVCTTDDFRYPTVCRFTCQAGFQLLGSRKRSCLAIAFWTGIAARCREITCPPLPEIRDGTIQPALCSEGEVPFGTTCQLSCVRGYKLRGPAAKQCTPDGTWSAVSREPNQCIDRTPPYIQCPENIEVTADPENVTTEVTWAVPVAVDNSGFIPVLTSDPAVVPPAHFPIGFTVVTYRAEDLSENVAKCKFYILVVDETPPRIDKCFSPEPVVSAGSQGNVTWEEPIFSDNSGMPVEVQASHSPGNFPQGSTTVTYTAVDASGNNNTCVLEVEVSPHPCQYPDPPVHGERECRESEDGVHCVLSCHPGYAFVTPPPPEYFCAYDNVWTPADRLPFPDCAAQQISNEVLQPASITLTGDLSCAEHNFLNRVEQNIEAKVNDKVSSLCEEDITCDMDKVHTTCDEHEDFNKINLVPKRRRRSADNSKRRRQSTASLKFDFTLEGTVNSTGTSEEASRRQEQLSRSMKRLLKALQTQAKQGHFDVFIGGRWLRFSDMDFDDRRQRKSCPQGSVLLNNSCVLCPVGMFFNVVSHRCQSCPLGTYQPFEGQRTCMVCPEKTNTSSQNARSEMECRAQCLPGSVSPTGLERCETCRKGFYQSQYAQVTCLACPDGSTTLRRGARGKEQCRERCPPGHVSRTGLWPCYPCPHGTYQPDSGETVCIKCPDGADTDQRAATSPTQCIGFPDVQSDDARARGKGQERLLLDANECFRKPCKNGGTCLPRDDGLFDCKCAPGFEGVFCETEVNQCKAKPCLNGGTCSPLPGAYHCNCTPGFEGQKCERDIDECESSPCRNGGTCVDGPNSFTCNCPNGFQGVTCENDIDDCEASPCLNDGTCQDDVSGYRCACPVGFTGTTCEIETDECLSAPCQNGGTCVDEQSDYRCECPGGYTGKQCEDDINECASKPCQNGAKCEDLLDAYKCHCKEGFTGRNCESEVDAHYQLDFPTASTVDYALMPINRPLTSLTVSFWMLSDDFDNYGTAFSYAVPNMDNALTLTDYNGFAFYVNQESVITDVTTNDGYWHHVVITWSSIRGNWKIYVDGLLNDSGFDLSTARRVPGKGTLVIGQEQDSVGGGFSANEAFVGSLTEFNMWDEELPLNVIERMRVSCEEFHGNVIAWPDVQGSLKGSLSTKPSPFCQECPVPSDIEFGTVTYTTLTPGSEVSYSCQRGFNVAGPASTVCLVTGEYEMSPPSCQRVDCGHPGNVDNGYFNEWRFFFDSRVRFRCQRGYKIKGPDTLYCNEYGEWEGERPECVEITCSLPQLSQNTLLTPPRETPFRPGETATFGCSVGHKLLTAHNSVSCQSDGTWDRSVPTCDPQTCSSPPFIPFGEPDSAQEEYNVGQIVRYTCEFGYTLNLQGANPTGALSCLPTGEWETPEPECVIVTCDDPPLVAHSTMHGDERTFLSRVTYECYPGYAPQGSDIIECLETGEWDPQPPSCQPVNCGQPPDLPHGKVEGSDFSFNAVVTCTCLPGYKLKGRMRRRCNESGLWHGPDPVCKPVACGRLSDPNHGQVRAPVITFQAEAVYTCDEGYNLVGDSATRTCKAEGRWSGEEPRCEPVSCVDVPDIDHGSFKGPAAYTFGARVVYSCQQGYILRGHSELVCQSSGIWSHKVPACDPVECPQVASPDHGSVNVKGITFTNKVEYSCDSDYRLEGVAVRTCEADGTWSGEEPVCVSITCDPPPDIPHGQYDYKDLKIGSIVRYTCDKGYKLEGYEVRRCQSNLTLTGQEPTCVPIVCRRPDPPMHGSVTFSDSALTLGTTATFTCDMGYQLGGKAVLTCGSRGVFIGTPPSCRPVECNKPAEIISNGRMLGTTFTFNSTIRYECDEGYRMDGAPERVCQADGNWDKPIPVCIVVECPRPSVVNGFPSTFRRDFGTVITFTCRGRHRLEGSAERTCQADGTWSGEDTVCVKVVCPPPLPLENGVSRQVSDMRLTYSCNVGYRLEGSNMSRCSDQGQWEPSAPSCVLITCPDISSVTLLNGVVIFPENFRNYGSQIQYKCNSGYNLSGLRQRSCTETGEWEGEAPICHIVSCPQPNQLPNGSIKGDVFTFGAEIRYECDEGHNLVGGTLRRCEANGLWEGEGRRCEPVQCPEIQTVFENGIVSTLSNAFGGQVRYSCLPGFMLQGEAVRNCLASRQWSGAEPVCVALECPAPEAVESGTIIGQDYTIGRSIMYSCNLGFQPVGSTVLVCLPNLMWSGVAPVCERISCPELPPLQFGTAVGDRRYGDGVLFVCDPGYEIIGHYSRSCLANGTWDGEQPECSPVSCGLPPMIDHAMPDLENGTLFPAAMMYRCDTGYKPRGNGAASCLADGLWSVPDLECLLVTCHDIAPNSLKHGTVSGDAFSYGEVIRFACDLGYRLKGSNSTTCLAEGRWSSKIPVCRLVTCGEPGPISHGTVTAEDYDYNNTATYKCSTGYRLNGEQTSRCTETGKWSADVRECVLVTCEAPPNVIPNGGILESQDSYIYQDTVEYQCDRGFELVGTGRLTCTAAGVFAPSPPSCSKIQCPSPETPTHGNVQVIDDALIYSCVPGYELAGLPHRRCLDTGQWEGVAPVCIAILCPAPLPISNGFVQGNEFQFGSTVNYVCDLGFTLQGEATRTCTAFRAWSGAEPVCVRVSCGPPRPIEHGRVLGESYLFNDTVIYECQLGFAVLGGSERVCLASGEWSGDDPYCDEIMCDDPPEIGNATHDADSPSDSLYSFGSLVMYMCDVGHVMSGASSIVCQEDGSWSEPLPACPPVVCPSLATVEHGSMSGDDYTYGGEVVVTCDAGYRLVGFESVVCMEDGTWDVELPVCEQIVCQAPVIDHGQVALEGEGDNVPPPATFLPGQTAQFSCLPGYILDGAEFSSCQDDSRWTSKFPVCLRVLCGPPPAVFHARVFPEGPHHAGDTASYTCDLGYEMEGPVTLLCDDNGSWAGPHPTCVDVVCDNPPSVENARITGEDFSKSWSTPADGWVQYECLDGFRLEEGQDGRLACLRGGAWSADLPRCIHIDCGPPPVPFNASVTASGSTAGSIATVTCNLGHFLPDGRQQTEMVCDISGTWAGQDNVHCEPVDCSQPPPVPHSAPLERVSTTYGSRVSYRCLEGYVLSGHEALRCSEGGSWVTEGDQIPSCLPVDCGRPETGMQIVGSEFTFGKTLTLTCPEGTRPVGSERVTCMANGRWSPEPGRCEKITCPPVVAPENGYIFSRSEEVGGRVEILCQDGYQLTADPVITCLPDGTWNSPVPTCQLLRDVNKMCVDRVTKPNAAAPPGDHFPGDSAVLPCRPGYRPEGDMTSLCLDNRTWTDPSGECRRLSCGPPPVEDRHRVKMFGRSYLYGDRVMFMCRRGMSPSRVPPTVTCTASGDWDGVVACVAQCKQPCKNGGRCVGLNKCKCMPGFTGRRCEIPICILPCLNGGKCQGPYRCKCPQGYYGSRCHKAVCSRPCQNGGRCLHPNRCQCFNGFRPPFCES